MMKKTAKIWEHKVGNNATIANFCLCENVELSFEYLVTM